MIWKPALLQAIRRAQKFGMELADIAALTDLPPGEINLAVDALLGRTVEAAADHLNRAPAAANAVRDEPERGVAEALTNPAYTPVKPRVVGWCRHYVARGVTVQQLAAWFNVGARDLRLSLEASR